MCVCLFVCSFASRNVTPHTQVDFKVWSHHTLKADALLGKATLDLIQALEQHDRKCMIKLHKTYRTFIVIQGVGQHVSIS